MPRFAVIALSIATLFVGLAGCRPYTDLGVPCLLVKGQDDAGNPIHITNGEIVEGLEYISHGGECDNFVCVRDAGVPKDTANPDEPASGYCSNNCVPQADGSAGNCIPENPSHEDPESPQYLSCREISLDPELLAYFRDNDPEQFRRLFGENATPFYCARGKGPGSN